MILERVLSRLHRVGGSPLFALRGEAQRSLGKDASQSGADRLRLKTDHRDDRRSAELESSGDRICTKRSAQNRMKHLGQVRPHPRALAGAEHNRRKLRIGDQELPRLLNQMEPTAALGDAPAKHAHGAAALQVITAMLLKVGRRFSTRFHPSETNSLDLRKVRADGTTARLGGASPLIRVARPRRGLRLWLLAVLLAGSSSLAARPYRGGVVATAHPAASEAALAMLNRGGNAVDAAIAAAFTLAVVDPIHSGLGGGGFALFYDARSRTTQALDFREMAPGRAEPTMYLRNGKLDPLLATDGALAVAVPGAVAGYFDALSRAGTLKPAVVIAPAIRAARRGVVVTPMYQRLATRRLDCLRANRDAARIFLRPNAAGVADVPPLGTRIAQPQLTATLEVLAKEGPSTFYRGKLARSIASAIQELGGIVTLDDLAGYHVILREPLRGSYRGHPIATMPPPSAGGLTLLQVLAMAELLQPSGDIYGEPESLHIYVEALRRAFADRAKHLGDPDFVEVPVAQLISSEHLRELLRGFDPGRATPVAALLPQANAAQGTFGGERHTSHLSVIDRWGNAVALTTTINESFGSCVVAPGTGILLNDQMDDFAAHPWQPNLYGLVMGEANAVAPGRRPVSSMAPTIVFQKEGQKRALLVAGGAGGSTIPSSVLQIAMHLIDHGLDLLSAVGHGRLHHQLLPDQLRVEPHAYDPATLNALAAKGHRLEQREPWGDAEAVMEDPRTGLRYGASDPRNEGAALGQD